MNSIVPAANVKVLAKTLQALSKVGDELFIEARKNKLSLTTMNLSKTVCSRFDFLDSFFSSYEVSDTELEESDGKLMCKLHMKVILPLFKGNLEKKLDFFKIEYENNADIMLVKMKYRLDDIIMVHKLRLLEPENLTIGISTDSGANNICAPASMYNQLLTMFCSSDDEMTFEITKPKLIARNYCVGAPYRPKAIRSQVNLNAGEFALYSIQEETTINFAIKPLRTVVHFADGFNLNIGLNFDTGGRPLSMIMKNPTFEANFIVATLNPNSDMQSTMTTSSIPSKILALRQNTEAPNITIEDRQAIENENWEEFDLDMNENNKEHDETNMAVRNSASSKSKSSSPSLKTLRKNNSDNNSKIIKSNSSRSKSSSSGMTDIMNKAIDVLEENMRLSEACKKNGNVVGAEKDDSDTTRKRSREFIFRDPSRDTENVGDDRPNNANDDDVVPRSPESPRTKKAKFIFGRCYDPTFQTTMLGEVLVGDSDSE